MVKNIRVGRKNTQKYGRILGWVRRILRLIWKTRRNMEEHSDGNAKHLGYLEEYAELWKNIALGMQNTQKYARILRFLIPPSFENLIVGVVVYE